jgi:hypothetical protein
MAEIVQQNMDRSFVFRVLPALQRHGNIKVLSTALSQKRNNRLLRSVFRGLID